MLQTMNIDTTNECHRYLCLSACTTFRFISTRKKNQISEKFSRETPMSTKRAASKIEQTKKKKIVNTNERQQQSERKMLQEINNNEWNEWKIGKEKYEKHRKIRNIL